jgi:hypothetical protein
MSQDLYQEDFYRWTRDQAQWLRRGVAAGNRIDYARVAEEIEDLGRSERNKVSSLLRQVAIHLIKRALEPDSPATRHWMREAASFLEDAREAFTPGMAQTLSMEKIHAGARRAIAAEYRAVGEPVPPLPDVSPFTLAAMLEGEATVEDLYDSLRQAVMDVTSNGTDG